MRRINEKWMDEMLDKMNNHGAIDVTTEYNICIQWLIRAMTSKCIPFKLYNLGAGVKRITTNTDTCPCCKQKVTP